MGNLAHAPLLAKMPDCDLIFAPGSARDALGKGGNFSAGRLSSQIWLLFRVLQLAASLAHIRSTAEAKRHIPSTSSKHLLTARRIQWPALGLTGACRRDYLLLKK